MLCHHNNKYIVLMAVSTIIKLICNHLNLFGMPGCIQSSSISVIMSRISLISPALHKQQVLACHLFRRSCSGWGGRPMVRCATFDLPTWSGSDGNWSLAGQGGHGWSRTDRVVWEAVGYGVWQGNH